jgi:hypothetical protein
LFLGSAASGSGDGGTNGGTAEDRFFGIFHPGGIAYFTVTASSWELDHLQYGLLAPIPEPSTWMLLTVGGVALGLRRWRWRAGGSL